MHAGLRSTAQNFIILGCVGNLSRADILSGIRRGDFHIHCDAPIYCAGSELVVR